MVADVGQHEELGPDLGNLVKLAIDGLSAGRKDKMGLGMIHDDGAVKSLVAEKRCLTKGGKATGIFVTIAAWQRCLFLWAQGSGPPSPVDRWQDQKD